MLQTTNGKLPTTMLKYKQERNLHSVAIMIEVTSRRMESSLLTSNYSQMPAVALHHHRMLAIKAIQNRVNGVVISATSVQ